MAVNAQTGERSGILPSVLAQHLATFEAPDADEAPVVLRSPEEIDAWLSSDLL
jgi:hypothetical protein